MKTSIPLQTAIWIQMNKPCPPVSGRRRHQAQRSRFPAVWHMVVSPEGLVLASLAKDHLFNVCDVCKYMYIKRDLPKGHVSQVNAVAVRLFCSVFGWCLISRPAP